MDFLDEDQAIEAVGADGLVDSEGLVTVPDSTHIPEAMGLAKPLLAQVAALRGYTNIFVRCFI